MPTQPLPETTDDALFLRAVSLFDDYNRLDPNQLEWKGEKQPQEWLHARFLDEWVARLAPAASVPLRLAARCQHIGRWEISRDTYPAGRTGYIDWRNALKQHHADIAGRLIIRAGYGQEMVDAVLRIVHKQGIKRDPEVQCMENALCLVFLEHQYDDFCRRYPDKVVSVLRKTWSKMDDAGRTAAQALPLSADGRRHLLAALAED